MDGMLGWWSDNVRSRLKLVWVRAGCWFERQTIGFNCFLESWNQGSVPDKAGGYIVGLGDRHPNNILFDERNLGGKSIQRLKFISLSAHHFPNLSSSMIIQPMTHCHLHHSSTFLHPSGQVNWSTSTSASPSNGVRTSRCPRWCPSAWPATSSRASAVWAPAASSGAALRRPWPCCGRMGRWSRPPGHLGSQMEPVVMPLGNGRLWPWLEVTGISIWLFNIAMDNGPFIDGLIWFTY